MFGKTILPGEIVAVFEEDAFMDETSSNRLRGLSLDMEFIEWEVLMLESGQFIASGKWEYIGDYAATCAKNKSNYNTFAPYATYPSSSSYYVSSYLSKPYPNLCTWFGTRGYLITFEGAQKLLAHAFPVHVQIDALMGLLAAFNSDFKMFWTRENIVHQRLLYVTKVWDACLKCCMPKQAAFYLFLSLSSLWMMMQISYTVIQKFIKMYKSFKSYGGFNQCT